MLTMLTYILLATTKGGSRNQLENVIYEVHKQQQKPMYYLSVKLSSPKSGHLGRVLKTADQISHGDVIL